MKKTSMLNTNEINSFFFQKVFSSVVFIEPPSFFIVRIIITHLDVKVNGGKYKSPYNADTNGTNL
jgi:hypothetical protein